MKRETPLRVGGILAGGRPFLSLVGCHGRRLEQDLPGRGGLSQVLEPVVAEGLQVGAEFAVGRGGPLGLVGVLAGEAGLAGGLVRGQADEGGILAGGGAALLHDARRESLAGGGRRFKLLLGLVRELVVRGGLLFRSAEGGFLRVSRVLGGRQLRHF